MTGAPGDEGRFRELEITFDPLIFGVDADHAALRVEWRPRPDPSDPAYFVFHYYDSIGRDFGWHREPGPHVDGLSHFQKRRTSEKDYDYEPTDLEGSSPVELLCAVLGRVEDRLDDE